MKTAGYQIEAITLWCPECHEAYDSERSGSSMLTVEDRAEREARTLVCRVCGTQFRVPSILKRLGGN